MIKLKDVGRFETLPERALQIYEGDVAALREALAQGWDMEQQIELSRYTSVSPLHLALLAEQLPVVKLLIEHGANLNDREEPAFLIAVRYCDEETVRFVASQGARLDARNRVKSNAYSQAYYGNKANIPLIHELGLDIRKHGGYALRTAVDRRDLQTVAWMLDHGADINFNATDQVYPYQATPLTVAARNGDLAMVKYLVQRGADVTQTEKGGERAYTIAVSGKHAEMADFLRSVEPPAFHDRENKLHALRSYKLPPELIAFLSGSDLCLELPNNECEVDYVQFFSLTDTVEMKAGRRKLLRLSAEVDNYSSIVIVWNPKAKCIGYYDEEHEEYGDLCPFAEFLAHPGVYLQKILEGEEGVST
ncbi:ankyrin repeat domain-containing protein [Brevibacillus brevis]|uniref:Ankyrin repeat domain-containing protein n=1 Tax=Brevibacillus brevis TaxID=1393 RepID=A0ABY9T765_BREBE|nr:ankyrin repeat domain-containing protein [Brevibacillus brevis]WNC15930.1 ankyrin repeat domain-containing protein [Brevibacillus brevis]